MGLCNNCYNEAYKDHKTHISLDKMWLELARSFRDENEKLQDKIADLEAKFAESEKQIERLQTELHMKVDYIHELLEVKDDYKQQLQDLPKKIMEEIEEESDFSYFDGYYSIRVDDLDAILKKYGGENE